jgi:hypothetical protein
VPYFERAKVHLILRLFAKNDIKVVLLNICYSETWTKHIKKNSVILVKINSNNPLFPLTNRMK